jgi:hypothetical protein
MGDAESCIHEAAHLVAVALLLPGDLLVRASVVPGGDLAGYVVHRRARELSAEEQAERGRAELIVCLVGEVACQGFPDPSSGCASDHEDARALAGRIAPGAEEEALNEGKEAARWFYDDHWQAITDVAKELGRFRTFEGEGLTRMVTHYVEQDRASPWCEERRQRNREARARLAERRGCQQHGDEDGSNAA